jgi:hypothetical protein
MNGSIVQFEDYIRDHVYIVLWLLYKSIQLIYRNIFLYYISVYYQMFLTILLISNHSIGFQTS